MKSPNNKKAVIYARTATATSGTSIESQIEKCKKFVFANDLFAERVFIDDSVSGKAKSKPKRSELISYVKQHHVSYVVVSRLDRWSRDLLDTSTTIDLLKALGAELIDISMQPDLTPEQELKASMYGSFVQYNRSKRSELIKRGIQAKKQRKNSQ